MNERDEHEFAAYFAERCDSARRTAYLMCGDWGRADELARAAFASVHRDWRRLGDRTTRDGYLRGRIARAVIGDSRKPWRRDRNSVPVPRSPDVTQACSEDGPDADDELAAALRRLPPRQRVVLVLRYFTGLDVRGVAEVLHCGAGDVKSHTARGLVTIRRSMGARVRTRE